MAKAPNFVSLGPRFSEAPDRATLVRRRYMIDTRNFLGPTDRTLVTASGRKRGPGSKIFNLCGPHTKDHARCRFHVEPRAVSWCPGGPPLIVSCVACSSRAASALMDSLAPANYWSSTFTGTQSRYPYPRSEIMAFPSIPALASFFRRRTNFTSTVSLLMSSPAPRCSATCQCYRAR